ncbi:Pole remodelling regulatory diguanylate cyclase [Thermodesulfovibrio sp. N1]|uniref:response regulator n=1 Tax=unclassified Thermodesulfovibrio TaxID=2645936 RepID=UPI00083BA129|nr:MULTISPECIES: response regulator [unclassified Thermodesulfovibrio]MDI1472585.1 response regulator [Thermodesulfovibrio sp. 1176]ODA44410.1 Pole remodelling regulatory diguanylate cyclase [Thermodesulfovibrio sp. N1]
MAVILVVDDNEINRKLLIELLEYHGYNVISASNGAEAIKIAKENKPDLILMDVQMPVMDGLTALKIIKDDPEIKEIKVLIISSVAFSDKIEKALSLGAEDYITKPYETRKIPEIIKKHLKKE